MTSPVKTEAELRIQLAQMVYMVLPKLIHDEGCENWEECCTAKQNALTLLELTAASLVAAPDEVTVAIHKYLMNRSLANIWKDLEIE